MYTPAYVVAIHEAHCAQHTHAIVLTKPPNGKKQTESACLSSGNCEMNEFHSKTYTHVSSSIELACFRLVPRVHVCVSVSNSFLVYYYIRNVYLWRLLLACFHFSSSLFNGSSTAFFPSSFAASLFHYSLFCFCFPSRFHFFVFVICFEPRSALVVQLLNIVVTIQYIHTCGILWHFIFLIISFALPVLVCCCGFCCSSCQIPSLILLQFRCLHEYISAVAVSFLVCRSLLMPYIPSEWCIYLAVYKLFFEMFAVTVAVDIIHFLLLNIFPLYIDSTLYFQTIQMCFDVKKIRCNTWKISYSQ